MLKRWFIYSLLSLLIGINARLLFERFSVTVFFFGMLALSVVFLVFGFLKKDRFA